MSWTADYEERKTRETVENFLDSSRDQQTGRVRLAITKECPTPKWYDQLGQPLWATWAEPWAEGWMFQGNPIGRATNVRVEGGQLKATVSPYVPATSVEPVQATSADPDHWAKRSIYCRA